MTKPIIILFSEAIGAFTFSAISAVVTYFYTDNSQLSLSGVGSVSIGGSPKLYVLFSTILFTWIGMLIGGIVGFNILSGKSSKKLAGNLGLTSGLILFLILFLSFKLKQEISLVFVTLILIVSLFFNYSCGLMCYFLTKYVLEIHFRKSGGIAIVLVSLVLPLTIFIVIPILYVDNPSSFLKNLIESLGSAIIVFPPMLLIWLGLAIFSDFISKTKAKPE